jgi:hypothetical protein
MSDASTKDAPDARPAWDVPKSRQCLRCSSAFESEWSGERICPRCKTSAAWKNGQPRRGNGTVG